MSRSEALRELYNDLYAGSYPGATFDEVNGTARCILVPMHAADPTDPLGTQTSLQVRFSYPSANGKYYIFFVCNEVKNQASDSFSHTEYVRFAAYPTDGSGGAVAEPTGQGEAAQRQFWDMING